MEAVGPSAIVGMPVEPNVDGQTTSQEAAENEAETHNGKVVKVNEITSKDGFT